MQSYEQFFNAIATTSVTEAKYFKSTASTNLIALDWLEKDAPDGAIVYADHQSSGRGRFDRLWVTEPDVAIALSIIVRPDPDEINHLPLFSPLAALALVDILASQLGINAEIKWPNDVLIHRAKTSGILTETVWRGSQLLGLVVGIGVNVFRQSIPPKDLLQFPATCLQDHTSQQIDRYTLIAQLITSFNHWRPKIGSHEFMNQWQKRLAFRGEKVYIKQKDGNIQLSGILKGITNTGDLEIQTEDSQIRSITAGDVHLRPAEPEI